MKFRTNMAVALFGLAAIMVLPASLLAQTPVPPKATTPPAQEASAHRQGIRRLLNGLNLTEGQKSRIRTIMGQHHKQVQALKANTTLAADKQKDELKKLRKEARKQIMDVLTADQRTKLKELRKDEKEKSAEQTTAK